MRWWDNFRNYFYLKNLQQKLAGEKPMRVLTNLHDAKSIGIIYNSTQPDNDIIITRFAEQLRQEGKQVEILGYINDSKTDHKADVSIINNNHLNWHLTPVDTRVEKFAEKQFDLLFAAFTGVNYPLEYIARISKAKWRVGTFHQQKTDYYELMINVGDKTEVSYFLEQAIHYLNQIQYAS